MSRGLLGVARVQSLSRRAGVLAVEAHEATGASVQPKPMLFAGWINADATFLMVPRSF